MFCLKLSFDANELKRRALHNSEIKGNNYAVNVL